MNQAIHSVDLLRWIMGDVVAIKAFATTINHDIEVEDTVTAALTFANNALGMIQATTSVGNGIDKRLEIYGERGTVIIEGEIATKWVFDDGFSLDINSIMGNSFSASSPLIEDVQGHALQISDMVKAILEDREPSITGRDAAKSVKLVLEIYNNAIKTG